jgi:hypothetical protein
MGERALGYSITILDFCVEQKMTVAKEVKFDMLRYVYIYLP